MNRKMQAILPAMLLGIVITLPAAVQAQVTSRSANVTLSATVADSISLNVSTGNVGFSLVPGTGPTAGSSSVSVNSLWSVSGSQTMSIWGYFANSAAALTDGNGNSIPSSHVLVDINGSGPAALTGTAPAGGAGAGQLFMKMPVAGSGSEEDTLELFIDLTAQPNLPAGIYTGILSLQARAI